MNILYVCHRFPFPPKRGGKIRPFNMIKHLTAQGHNVTVCSLARSTEEAKEAQGIAPYCHDFKICQVDKATQIVRMALRLPLPTPSSMGYFYSPRLEREIRAVVGRGNLDLIFTHCSSVAQYVSHVTHIPKILDFGDMDSQKWLEYSRYKSFPWSLGYKLEGMKLQCEERRLTTRFDMCTATTRAEWETLNGLNVSAETDWFPNGVDSEYFSPGEEDYEPDTLSFIGRMDYFPNQECMFDFCRNTLPLLRAQKPNMKLMIVGADPTPEVLKLAALPGVTVTGSVPDVRPYIRKSALMVAPLNIARGTQNKILEAMAMGIPVVASRIAAGGVDANVDEHLLAGRTPLEYSAAILKILNDKSERSRLSAAGRARMLSHHSWASSMLRLDRVIERCAQRFYERKHVPKLANEGRRL